MMIVIWIIIGGFILIQALTLLLRLINNRGARPARSRTTPESVKPIKGSPFSAQDVFQGYPTLIKLNNGIIEKYQKITANKELATQYRNDLYGLLDIHKRLVDQWRENVGAPGYEMLSVSAEILAKINGKLDEIIRDSYRESVDKLKIENKVLDHIK